MQIKNRDLIGKRFGHLKVVARRQRDRSGYFWRCVCDCGNSVIKAGRKLTQNWYPLKHCGHRCPILKKHMWKFQVKHGMFGTRPYRIWDGMKKRCCNPSDRAYKDYGGRGIKICKRWLESFQNFWNDMEFGYRDDLIIERKNNNGNYCRSNCQWTTYKVNNNNRRSSIHLQRPGFPKYFLDVARAHEIPIWSLYRDIKKGHTWEQILKEYTE